VSETAADVRPKRFSKNPETRVQMQFMGFTHYLQEIADRSNDLAAPNSLDEPG
jgi:hypothetical protein